MPRGNRKKGAGGYLVSWRLTVLLVSASFLCLCYLWLRGRCEALGDDLKELEARQTSLQRLLLIEQSEWSDLCSPSNIEQALQRHGLVMTWPSKDQIVRLDPRETPKTIAGVRPPGPRTYERVVMND